MGRLLIDELNVGWFGQERQTLNATTRFHRRRNSHKWRYALRGQVQPKNSRVNKRCAGLEPAKEDAAGADPTGLALLRRLRKELSWLTLDGLTAALRTAQMSSLMLGDVFDMLEDFAALRATILVGRHGASPVAGSSPTGGASLLS
jgi:hypothetical protein